MEHCYEMGIRTKVLAPFFITLYYGTTNTSFSTGIYLLKVNNRTTRTKCEICSKLTIKTSERRHRHTSSYGVSIVNFEQLNADW